MQAIESGKGIAEVARMFQVSAKRLETWKGEWRAKGELAFPGKGSRPQSKLVFSSPTVLNGIVYVGRITMRSTRWMSGLAPSYGGTFLVAIIMLLPPLPCRTVLYSSVRGAGSSLH